MHHQARYLRQEPPPLTQASHLLGLEVIRTSQPHHGLNHHLRAGVCLARLSPLQDLRYFRQLVHPDRLTSHHLELYLSHLPQHLSLAKERPLLPRSLPFLLLKWEEEEGVDLEAALPLSTRRPPIKHPMRLLYFLLRNQNLWYLCNKLK